jgi:hypothetical protein
LATLFGVLVFIFETILPTPIDKVFTVFQATLLSLGYLLLGVLGATYIALIGGLLTAIWRTSFAPFTIAFALLFGLLIDAFCWILKARGIDDDVKERNLILAVTISTIIVGLSSYSASVVFGLLPRNPFMEIAVLALGILSGMIGGHLSIILWKKIS